QVVGVHVGSEDVTDAAPVAVRDRADAGSPRHPDFGTSNHTALGAAQIEIAGIEGLDLEAMGLGASLDLVEEQRRGVAAAANRLPAAEVGLGAGEARGADGD